MSAPDDDGDERNVFLDAFAQGIAGNAVAIALLAHLCERKIITRDEGIAVIDRALSSLEWQAEAPSGPGLDEARQLLERLLVGWRGKPKS